MQNAQIAARIKSLCSERGIPVKKLLIDCGGRMGLIYELEKRDKTPSITIVNDIAAYFDVSIDYLVGRTEKPEVNR